MQSVYRKEFKYQITKKEFYRIQKQLDGIMQKDSHGGADGYMVRSLYFDTLYDRDMYATMDGLMEKRKIRLRTYSAKTKNYKLECKCKFGSDGVKHVVLISRQQAMRMVNRDYQFLADMDSVVAQNLYHKLIAGCYMPKSVVEYRRYAYLYPASDVRITFDHAIQASPFPFDFFEEAPAYYPLIEIDRGVLEIKYNDFLPSSLKNIVKFVDHMPVANSKYVQARLFTY